MSPKEHIRAPVQLQYHSLPGAVLERYWCRTGAAPEPLRNDHTHDTEFQRCYLRHHKSPAVITRTGAALVPLQYENLLCCRNWHRGRSSAVPVRSSPDLSSGRPAPVRHRCRSSTAPVKKPSCVPSNNYFLLAPGQTSSGASEQHLHARNTHVSSGRIVPTTWQ